MQCHYISLNNSQTQERETYDMCCPRELSVPRVEASHDPRVCIFRDPAPHLAAAVGVPLVVVVVVHVVHLEVRDQRDP